MLGNFVHGDVLHCGEGLRAPKRNRTDFNDVDSDSI
jgi:hypothetical protein